MRDIPAALLTLLLPVLIGAAATASEPSEPILLPAGSITFDEPPAGSKDLPSPDYPPSCFRPGPLPSFEASWVEDTPFFEFDAQVVDQQNPLALFAPVGVRVWRVPCHRDGSALLVEFERLGGLPLAPEMGIRQGEDAFRARISYEANTRITDDTTAIIPVFDGTGNRTVYVLAATPGIVAAELDLDGELEVLLRTNSFDVILPFPAFDANDYGVSGRMAINPRHSGSWYARARQGEGVFVEVFDQDDGRRGVLLSWYTHLDGRQQWLVGSALLESDEQRFLTIPLVRTEGTGFGPAFDPRALEQTAWGSVTISWFDCSRLEFDYEGLDGSGRLDLVRLTSIADLDCR